MKLTSFRNGFPVLRGGRLRHTYVTPEGRNQLVGLNNLASITSPVRFGKGAFLVPRGFWDKCKEELITQYHQHPYPLWSNVTFEHWFMWPILGPLFRWIGWRLWEDSGIYYDVIKGCTIYLGDQDDIYFSSYDPDLKDIVLSFSVSDTNDRRSRDSVNKDKQRRGF